MDRTHAEDARPEKAQPKRALTNLQKRIEDEVQMHLQADMERREKGGPNDLSEVDRELTMCVGALEGLYQRLGALAAKLGPVMPGGTVASMTQGPGRVDSHDFEVTTEVGQRINALHRSISEIEDALGVLVAQVRL